MELSFSTGVTISANSSTEETAVGVFKSTWTYYDETNDYSYDPTKISLSDWDHVTLYRNGILVWGLEP
jgi:hypothetical protein